jgi:hypothetical protein
MVRRSGAQRERGGVVVVVIREENLSENGRPRK